MEFNKRVKDVSQVFDSQWNVNHDYQERKNFQDARKEHFNRMFQIQEKEEHKKEILRANSVDGKVQTLTEKMQAANANERFARRNEFKNNFR
ncbi:MAG: hypothetical protein MR598_07780 [Erysipelotrichaceae bacterium]|nr:hypothetical protein [Erysipelotrichaceae bacterium]